MEPLAIGADYEQSNIGADPSRWHESMHLAGAAKLTGIAPLRHGTEQGRAVVMLVVDLPNGEQVVAQTTLRLFRLASAAILAGPIAAEEPIDD